MKHDPGLPANVDAERFVLGSILLDDVVYASAATLSPDCFSLEKHRRIFRRMGDLHARGEKIDSVTVHNELDKHGEAESCDGIGYLVSLDDGLPQVPNIEGYLRILQEKASLRKIIFTCRDLTNRALLRSESPTEIATAAQERFASIGTTRDGHYHSLDDIPALEDCGGGEVTYIREPELPCGAVVALTGDAGSGKSTLATAWARDAWVKRGVPSLFLDRENPLSAIRNRTNRLAMNDGPHYRWWGGWLETEAPQPDTPIILDWVKTCEPKPLVIVDSLSGFHAGDQNDATEMRGFLHRCRRLADRGATVIVIHHDGKADTAKDFRGSSDFKAAVDIAFHVGNFGENGLLDRVTLRCYKSRFGFGGSLTYAYADGRFVRRDAPEATQGVTEQLTSLLRTNPGIQASRFEELANQRGLGRNRARSFLDDGVLSRTIRCESGPKNTRRYFLAGTEDKHDL